MRYDLAEQTVYLFGAAKVKFEDVELTADRIMLDLANEEVQAFGTRDSAGAPVGLPEFTQGSEKVTADSIRYNFKTKEGLIKEVRTQESQMYAMARISKRHAQLIQLFDPPFDKSALEPGYIKGYIPGVRENGGQYTHAAIWSAMAFAEC